MPASDSGRAGRARAWLYRIVGRHEETIPWWQKPCDYCGGMVGNHTQAQLLDCRRDLRARADA